MFSYFEDILLGGRIADDSIERSICTVLDMSPLVAVTNREAVIFDGAEPVMTETSTNNPKQEPMSPVVAADRKLTHF